MGSGAEGEFLKTVASLGVGGVIAVFMFLVYRKDMLANQALILANQQVLKYYTDQFLTVIVENTKSNQQVIDVVKSLHRRLDKDEIADSQ